MAGDQLVGLYNAFNLNLPITSTTTTYNVDTTTLFDNNNDPFIFDLQTHLLLDQCSAYSTINNNMNLQFDHCSNDNYNFFPPNHDDQFDDHCYYPCSKDRKISCYDCRFESTEMNCVKGYKYCYPGFNYSTSDYSSTPLIHSLVVDNSSENKPMAVTKVVHGLSAQSVKARQRRRRITEKTHELGKLIPGGNKMNTAEMFHSAFKYIKFLQAQVGFLQFMASIDQDSGDGDEGCARISDKRGEDEQLQVLLASSIAQEKLYSAEKCLVPKQFHEVFNAKDHEDNLINC
ncbi:hypothetical protein Syun_019058 [Stephania yunnanensis]|uniref:BHLH domain-containing protein n=1 Tax=Stephania yunnanensis TaxID=152371 RepID=A0AAP0IVR8_9MAGN